MKKNLKVSFCTTCKGRLEHLKHTLPINLKNNADYPNTEFVILDYDSQDGLEEWVKENYADEIRSGKIRYAKYEPAPYFQMAHAKNMAHRLATGDVVCNLDADNITAPGFAGWLNKQFSLNQDIYVRPDNLNTSIRKLSRALLDKTGKVAFKNSLVKGIMVDDDLALIVGKGLSGAMGRIVMTKDNFIRLNGYQESEHEGWGGDDQNLEVRAHQYGLKHIRIPITQLGEVINHSNEMRVKLLSPEEKKKSEARLERLHHGYQRHFIKKASTELGRHLTRKKMLSEASASENPDGHFGCGTVCVNFKDTITLEPVPVEQLKSGPGR